MSAVISATVTWALSIKTPDELIVTVTSVPKSVVTIWPLVNIPDVTLSPTTWCNKILVNSGRSFKRAARVPEGSALNAASVGAKRVKGPLPESVVAREHASIAVFKDVWSGELDTMSYTVLAGGPFTVMVPTIPLIACDPTEQSYM